MVYVVVVYTVCTFDALLMIIWFGSLNGDICRPTWCAYLEMYTVSWKNNALDFDDNFDKYRLVFKILSLPDFEENCLCNYYGVFHLTLTVLLHYIVKFKNLK